MTQSKSPAITLTSAQLQERVERLLGQPVPDRYWPDAELLARMKLEQAKVTSPNAAYYDDGYLAILTRDTVIEMDLAYFTMTLCQRQAKDTKEEHDDGEKEQLPDATGKPFDGIRERTHETHQQYTAATP